MSNENGQTRKLSRVSIYADTSAAEAMICQDCFSIYKRKHYFSAFSEEVNRVIIRPINKYEKERYDEVGLNGILVLETIGRYDRPISDFRYDPISDFKINWYEASEDESPW